MVDDRLVKGEEKNERCSCVRVMVKFRYVTVVCLCMPVSMY